MDSCCFIDAVKGDVGDALPADRLNDLWYIRHCLKAGQAGEIDVITSTLTIAESRRADAPPTDEVKRLFNSILTSGKVVQLAQMTQAIAERARDLHWEHNINLGGADAIHVATALTVGCKEFLTFDRKKARSPLAFAAELAKLGLRVIPPSDTALLPADYLQGKLTDPTVPSS
jgi:predicted nucleic acid-binding protein